MSGAWLNIDAGELEKEPEEIYRLAHHVNVACGGHAGDEESMTRAVLLCKAHGTALGAHPSYPDRAGFGRKRVEMDEAALRAVIAGQCGALASVAERAGGHVRAAKLHGALYHAGEHARAAVLGIVDALGPEVMLIGPASGPFFDVAREVGLRYAVEGFADRGVREDGSLVPRGQPGALVLDPEMARARARELARSVDTVCVHGDTPNAVAIARAVREELDAQAG